MRFGDPLRRYVREQRPVWTEGTKLAAPVMVEHILRTLMRTTDLIVSGMISPAAVAAVGLGDMYGRVLVRAGLGIGGAATALSSQDTGSGAAQNRDQAVIQAIVIALLAGIPFMVFGALFSRYAISVLGAVPEVVQLGAQYLGVIMFFAPVIHLTFVGAAVLQGIGDTRTPMIINVFANIINISLTVLLAFGIGPFPEMSVLGVAVATVIGETLAATLFLAAIYGPRTQIALVRPTDVRIGRQLIAIATPRFIEGLSTLAVSLPFNAILLGFGTEVNAAYHIGRRLFQQLLAPLIRSYNIATNVLVGQALGRNNPDQAYAIGNSMVVLGVLSVGAITTLLLGATDLFVSLFTADRLTRSYALGFSQAYGVAAVFVGVFSIYSGALRGGSETRTAMYATLSGSFIFLLGTTYLFGVELGYGVIAAYAGIVLNFVWRSGYAGWVYRKKRWIAHGHSLMRKRGSMFDDVDE